MTLFYSCLFRASLLSFWMPPYSSLDAQPNNLFGRLRLTIVCSGESRNLFLAGLSASRLTWLFRVSACFLSKQLISAKAWLTSGCWSASRNSWERHYRDGLCCSTDGKKGWRYSSRARRYGHSGNTTAGSLESRSRRENARMSIWWRKNDAHWLGSKRRSEYSLIGYSLLADSKER